MDIEKIVFRGWKDCLKLTDGDTEVIVTTAFGPRIISLQKAGKGNHLKVFGDTAGKVVKSDGFVAYGGHRIWHAPERADRTYFSDNNACETLQTGDSVTVLAPVEKQTMLRRGLQISMDGGVVKVKHLITNTALFDVTLSVWGITQFDLGGVLVLPSQCEDTGLVANRAVSMWPYCEMNDRRLRWGGKYIAVTPDTKDTPPFKFGFTASHCRALYFNRNQAVVKKLEFDKDGQYPNYGCNFESYTNAEFIEIESLSALKTLATGQTAYLTEQWKIFDGISAPDITDEAATVRLIEGLIF